ncbi:hypothetical protein Sp245p_03085 [Azospirillum baldaniorum]|uniref:Uncharacterized protein n=1 Tax=Azospirillum baldaniorum TaxID=1064539 RepID=A0A9P1JTE3_9PROT|nr:hypothetical protein [Azospirillum baldaniorum]TWA73452.1 hypothetical protein FBZ85_116146 [Azospirillum brasilense]AWJ88840.1 hypothetical protein Sp245p_03085 [Azospirillum baldaniorum]NUB06817.1 hypothetical protein [Azospirillum baldaniorum]TWA62401.1 hypothetical protein FBZ84_111177 [Azospirillum baldaniorum]CCC99468.1 conserved exported protein of unknown function [Azospirillum baldaniorum]
MPWRSQCGALTLALFLTAPIHPAPAAAAGSVDCWLLDGDALTRAREGGLCKDAFSRNSQTGEAPVVTVTAAPLPARKPDPPPKKRVVTVQRKAKAQPDSQAAAIVRPAGRSGTVAEVDFGTQFKRDWNALMKKLLEP